MGGAAIPTQTSSLPWPFDFPPSLNLSPSLAAAFPANLNTHPPMTPSITILSPAGRGAYDFRFSATRLWICATGRAILLQDHWSGTGQLRGECYRTYEAPLTSAQAATLLANALPDDPDGGQRAELADLIESLGLDWHELPTSHAKASADAFSR